MGLPWTEAVEDFARELAQTVSERPSHGLALVFGRSTADIEVGMVAVLARTLEDRVRWHRLELHGLDASASYAPGALIWVAGFESLEPDARIEALLVLNRARDSIRGVGTRVVVWIPETLRDAVFLHAADLLAWQDQVLSIPPSGLEHELGLPPWRLVRDVAAGWAHALVGPWLWGDKLDEARTLIARLPWAGIVGVDLDDAALRELGATDGGARLLDDLSDLVGTEASDDTGPTAYRLGSDAPWPDKWSRKSHTVPIIPIGHGRLPGPAISLDEGPCWVLPGDAPDDDASLPVDVPWLRYASASDAALVLTVGLGLLWLGAHRPEPARWSRVQALEPSHDARLPPCVLIWGAELLYKHQRHPWQASESAWAEIMDWCRAEEGELLSRPVGARLADAEDQLRSSRRVRAGLARAHGLDTHEALPGAGTLLGRFQGVVLVLSHDRYVEGTLEALGRRYRVAEGDVEDLGENEILVVRPWTWSARRGSLGRTTAEVDAWRADASSPYGRLLELMERGIAVVGVRPDDPELLWWTLRSPAPWALHGPTWVFPPETTDDQGVSRGELLGFEHHGYHGWHRFRPLERGFDQVVSHLKYSVRHKARVSPHQVPSPPVLLPDQPEFDVLYDLTRLYTLSARTDGAVATLPEALAEAGTERWHVAPMVDAWSALAVIHWARGAGDAGLPDPLRWLTTQLPADLSFFGLEDGWHRAEIKRLERTAAAPFPPAPRVLVVFLTPLPEPLRATVAAALERIASRDSLRVVVVDTSGEPWTMEQLIPTRREASIWPRWPKAYAEWLARRSPVFAGLLPWLQEQVAAGGPGSLLLSSPAFLSWLSDTVRDPMDPLGPEWALRITETSAAVQQRGFPILRSFDWPSFRRLIDLGAELRLAPGEHEIGATEGRAWPPRRVALPETVMGNAPVSFRRFRGFMAAGGYRRADLWSAEGWAWRERAGVEGPAAFDGLEAHDDAPVVGVSWYEAEAFCRWCRHELPTEVRWEAVVRYALRREEDASATLQFGVLEWCADWHDALYPNIAPRQDPRGPQVGIERVARGVPAWETTVPSVERLAQRRHFPPDSRRPDLGFRVMRDPDRTPRASDIEGTFLARLGRAPKARVPG